MCCLAYYKLFINAEQEHYRVTVSFMHPTSTAWFLLLISNIAVYCILNTLTRYKILLCVFYFVISFVLIILTATRAPILIYPFTVVFLITSYLRVSKRKLVIMLTIFAIATITTGLLFKEEVYKRYNDIVFDITEFNKGNTDTSIGARFAMWESGLLAGINKPFGQSLQSRNEYINNLAIQDNKFLPVLPFLTDNHLHNELIHNFSIFGIFGVIATILFFASIVCNFRFTKNNLNFSIFGILILYSIAEVFTYSSNIFSIICILILLFVITNEKKYDKN